MKNFLLNILVSILSLTLVFSTLELGCRYYMARKHKLNEYENLIEQQGFTPRNKKSGEKRVFIVGESAARGVPYTMESSFSGFLQALISPVDPSVKVVNTGIPGRHSYYQKEEGRTLVKYGADVVVIYAGNNDTRDFSNIMRDMPLAWIEFKLFWNSAFYHRFKTKTQGFSRKLQKKVSGQEPAINNNQDDVWHWTDEYLKKKKRYIENPEAGIARKMQAVSDYEKNLDDLAVFLKRKGIRVVVASLPIVHQIPPVISDYPRKGYEFELKLGFQNSQQKTQWETFIREGEASLGKKDYPEALKLFESALKLNQSHPILYHYLGDAYAGLGNYDEARAMYVAGKDRQIQSPGGDNHKNEALRRIAARHHLPMIEIQPAFEEISPNGLVGRNLFLDHCHPNILGHKVLAAAVMNGLCQSKEIVCPQESSPWSYWYEKISGHVMNPENLGREYLLTAFYLLNGSLWEPEPNYKDAVYYLEKAREVSPQNADVHAFLALCYVKLGENEKARTSLETLRLIDLEKLGKTLAEYPELKNLQTTAPS